MNDLIKQLKLLASDYGVIGIKQSFEDEGVTLDDVIIVRRITDICGIKSFVKIGGCEAKRDLYNCLKFGIDVVIAPMIESPFALSKFIDITKSHLNRISPFIVIESKTAQENLKEILKLSNNNINGIVIGRSDFTKSHLLDKSEVDSDFICEKVKNILIECKKYDIYTTIGGNISVKSVNFLQEMYKEQLLDRIETRNVVIELSNKNIHSIEEVIKKSLDFEIKWIQFKRENILSMEKEYSNRIETMKKRS